MEHDILLGFSFKFHVLGNNVKLAADGVLSQDNMCSRSILNLCKNELVFGDKSEREILKLPMISLASVKNIKQNVKMVNKSRVMELAKIEANKNVFQVKSTVRSDKTPTHIIAKLHSTKEGNSFYNNCRQN